MTYLSVRANFFAGRRAVRGEFAAATKDICILVSFRILPIYSERDPHFPGKPVTSNYNTNPRVLLQNKTGVCQWTRRDFTGNPRIRLEYALGKAMPSGRTVKTISRS